MGSVQNFFKAPTIEQQEQIDWLCKRGMSDNNFTCYVGAPVQGLTAILFAAIDVPAAPIKGLGKAGICLIKGSCSEAVQEFVTGLEVGFRSLFQIVIIMGSVAVGIFFPNRVYAGLQELNSTGEADKPLTTTDADEIARLQEQIRKLERSNERKVESVNKFKGALGIDGTVSLKDLQLQLQQERHEKIKISQKNEEAREAVKEFKKGIGFEKVSLKDLMKKLQDEKLSMQELIQNLQKEIAAIKTQPGESKENSAAQSELNMLQNESIAAKSEIAEKNKALDLLRKEHEALELKEQQAAGNVINLQSVLSNREEELSNQVGVKDNQIAQLQSQLQQLAQAKEAAELKYKSESEEKSNKFDTEFDRLKKEHEDLTLASKKRKELLESENSELEKKIRELDQIHVQQTKHFKEIEKSLEQTSGQENEELDREKFDRLLSEQQEKILATENELKKYHALHGENEFELTAIRLTELNHEEQVNAIIQLQREHLESLQEQQAGFNDSYNDLHIECEKQLTVLYSRLVGALTQNLQARRLEISEAAINKQSYTNQELIGQLKEVKDLGEKLVIEFQNVSKQLEDTKNLNESLRLKHEAVVVELEEAKKLYDELTIKYNAVVKELEETKENHKTLGTEKEKLSVQLNKSTKTNEEYTKLNLDLTNRGRQKTDEIKKKSAEIGKLKKELEELKKNQGAGLVDVTNQKDPEKK